MFRSLAGTAGNPFVNMNLRAINRSGGTLAVGELVTFQFNLNSSADTSGEAKGGGPGNPAGEGTWNTAPEPYTPEDGIWGNVVAPANPSTTPTMVAVVLDVSAGSGADDTEVLVCIQGVCQANLVSGNYDIGDALMPSTTGANKELIAYAAGDANRPVAVCLTEADSIQTAKVMLWGWMAFVPGNEA